MIYLLLIGLGTAFALVGYALAVAMSSALLGLMGASLAFLVAVSIYLSIAGPSSNRRR